MHWFKLVLCHNYNDGTFVVFGFVCVFVLNFLVNKITFENNVILSFYSTFLCSACLRATDRRNRLPKINADMANGISKRNVSNIFNLYQKRPNKPRMPPKLKKKPSPLKLSEKLEMLMPNFSHNTNNTNNGTAHNAVKTSDTKRGGRFSGSRNWWMISCFGVRDWLALGAGMNWKNKIVWKWLFNAHSQV